jgi:imidazolonepropionase-like amidohydrolase
MDDVTLPRAEWAAVARELASTSRGEEPSGLRHRIDRLLADTPASWADEPRTLWLDPSAATVVRAVVRRGRGLAVDPARARERAAGVAEAEDVIHDHQTQSDGPSYRIEHRTVEAVVVLGRTTAAHARQADLSAHAARLMASGATGELVLIDESTGDDVARRRLLSAPRSDPKYPGENAPPPPDKAQ